MTGMREQEVMYTYWSDVNLAHATVRVSHKPDRGWTPKAYKEREIPIPARLCDAVPVGWRRSTHCAAVAWSLRHGIHDAIFEAVTQPACAG